MKNLYSGPGFNLPKTKSLVALTAMLAVLGTQPAFAAIDNTAKATGTYNTTTVDSPTDSETVPVAPANASLQVVKAITAGPTTTAGTNTTATDSGDTISFSFTITNNGNITLTGVVPLDAGPQFNAVNGAGTMSGFTLTSGSATLAPGASNVYTATYTIAQADAIRAADITNGVSNVANAQGTRPNSTTYTAPNSAAVTATITGFSAMTIVKTSSLVDNPGGTALSADVGETINYGYTIVNTGTRSLTNVQVEDTHEGSVVALGAGGVTAETITVVGPLGAGASSNTVPNNGIINILAAGATATMTYAHTVNQTEFNNQ